MPSTYSNLKIQLMATGENSTTWGDVTNINLGTALEEAIVGSDDVTFASANVTLSLSNTNTSQTARNMRLRCTGTTGGSTRNLVVPSIEKPYIIQNDCADSIVIKTAAGTGITVPAGKTMWVYNDGINVVDATSHLTSLTLGAALPIASGGTGSNTAGAALTALGAYPASNPNGYTTNTGTVTSIAGTGTVNGITLTGSFTTSGSLTLGGTLSNVSLTTQVSGTLPVANGGTGATTAGGALANLGAAASGANTDITALDQDVTITATGTIAADTLGFRGLPQNSQTATYTLALADAGKHISITTGGVVIPANGSVAFPVGTAIVIFNNSGSSQNISITTDTMRQAGTANTGTRALAQYGLATCVKVASTTWVISGAGVS